VLVRQLLALLKSFQESASGFDNLTIDRGAAIGLSDRGHVNFRALTRIRQIVLRGGLALTIRQPLKVSSSEIRARLFATALPIKPDGRTRGNRSRSGQIS
jgi:hypothetical protein